MNYRKLISIVALTLVATSFLVSSSSYADDSSGDSGAYAWLSDPNNSANQILSCPSGQCTIPIAPISQAPVDPTAPSDGGLGAPSSNSTSNNQITVGASVPVVALRSDASILDFSWDDGITTGTGIEDLAKSDFPLTVSPTATSMKFKVTTSDGASVSIEGRSMQSGTYSSIFSVNTSDSQPTVFHILVTSEDKAHTTTATITVNRKQITTAFASLKLYADDQLESTITDQPIGQNLVLRSFNVPAKTRTVTFQPSSNADVSFSHVAIVGGDEAHPTKYSDDETAADFLTNGKTYAISPGLNIFQLQTISASGVSGARYQIDFWVTDDPNAGVADSTAASISLSIGASKTNLQIPAFSSTQAEYKVFIPGYLASFADSSQVAFLVTTPDPYEKITISEDNSTLYGYGNIGESNPVTFDPIETSSGQLSQAFRTDFPLSFEVMRNYTVNVRSENGEKDRIYRIGLGDSYGQLPLETLQFHTSLNTQAQTFPGFSKSVSSDISSEDFEQAMFVGPNVSAITLDAKSSSIYFKGIVWGGLGSSCTFTTSCTIPLAMGQNVITATTTVNIQGNPAPPSSVPFNSQLFGITYKITITKLAASQSMPKSATLASSASTLINQTANLPSTRLESSVIPETSAPAVVITASPSPTVKPTAKPSIAASATSSKVVSPVKAKVKVATPQPKPTPTPKTKKR